MNLPARGHQVHDSRLYIWECGNGMVSLHGAERHPEHTLTNSPKKPTNHKQPPSHKILEGAGFSAFMYLSIVRRRAAWLAPEQVNGLVAIAPKSIHTIFLATTTGMTCIS